MDTKEIRAKLWSMPLNDRALITAAVVDDLLYRAGSDCYEIDPQIIIQIVSGTIRALEKMREGEHEYSRKTDVNSIQTESAEESVQ
jgi:hypothetical protein